MSSNADYLPRFRKPPVVETVLGVYFRPLEKLTSAHIGMLWDRHFRKQFPAIQEQPPVEEIQEQFAETRSMPFPMVRWQVRPTMSRLWASSGSGEHVVQIQRNAFFSNWLKAGNDSVYSHYDARRQEFESQLNQLATFVADQELGQLAPTSWTITYINHILYDNKESVGAVAAKTLNVWTNQIGDGFLGEPDKLSLDFAFPMLGNTGTLNVNLIPVILPKENQSALRLDLTARGQLKIKDITNALDAIDLGHEWVTRGFASLTRPEMHLIWERE